MIKVMNISMYHDLMARHLNLSFSSIHILGLYSKILSIFPDMLFPLIPLQWLSHIERIFSFPSPCRIITVVIHHSSVHAVSKITQTYQQSLFPSLLPSLSVHMHLSPHIATVRDCGAKNNKQKASLTPYSYTTATPSDSPPSRTNP